jgi:hypothetical protein
MRAIMGSSWFTVDDYGWLRAMEIDGDEDDPTFGELPHQHELALTATALCPLRGHERGDDESDRGHGSDREHHQSCHETLAVTDHVPSKSVWLEIPDACGMRGEVTSDLDFEFMFGGRNDGVELVFTRTALERFVTLANELLAAPISDDPRSELPRSEAPLT